MNWIGAAAAGAFGAIFLLQALSQLVQNEALTYIAFDVLGQEIEKVLPYVILIWFVALLLEGSRGKSRILGWAVMSIVVGVELMSIVGPLVGINVESQKLLFLLPFVWLLVESGKRRPDRDIGQPASPWLASRRVSRWHSRQSWTRDRGRSPAPRSRQAVYGPKRSLATRAALGTG